jgi:hypothetical protein
LAGVPSFGELSHTLSGRTKFTVRASIPCTSNREMAAMQPSASVKAGTTPTETVSQLPGETQRSHFTGMRNESSFLAQSPMLLLLEVMPSKLAVVRYT